MGSVRKKPSGRWEARYRDPTGRVRGKTFPSRRDANEFLDRVGVAKQDGSWTDPRHGKQRFSEWARTWMRSKEHSVRPTTFHSYQYLLGNLLEPTFGRMPLQRIGPEDVTDWMAELRERGLSQGTVAKAFRLLQQIMTAAVKARRIAWSPLEAVDKPGESKRPMLFISEDEVVALSRAIDPHYATLVLTASLTGLRWGELAGLRPKNVDLLHGSILVVEQLVELNGDLSWGPVKTDRSKRRIDLDPVLTDLLQGQLVRAAGSGIVFPSHEGGPMRRSNFRRRHWMPATKKIGVPDLRFHDLRHTSVAIAVAHGAHPKAISERMGHSSITVTLDRYGHVFPSLHKDLAQSIGAGLQAAFDRTDNVSKLG